MIFERIDKLHFDEFYEMLEEAFPFVERKTKSELYNDFLVNENFFPCFIMCNGEKIGIISYWEFDDFIFAEHFAIFKNLRNKTLGTQVFYEFLNIFNVPVIFEVEKPYDETSERRIDFYKRIGVVFNDFNYFQPSYHNGDDKLPMFIASYPNSISQQQYLEYLGIVRKSVYRL